MTQLVRRLSTALAFAVFLVMAPLVVAWTSGYRWTGWRTGFSQTGSLYITSQPRATVYLNGKDRGQSPQRLPHLPPGSYTVELRRDGYSPWTSAFRMSPSAAVTLGPVQLYPSSFTITNLEQTGSGPWLTDRWQTIYAYEGTTSASVREAWPTPSPVSTVLPFLPTAAVASSNRQNVCYFNANQAAIVNLSQPAEPWPIPNIATPQWDTESSSLLYALQDGKVVRFDTLTKSSTALVPADSFGLVGSVLWSTISADQSTILYRQQAFGQANATLVGTLPDRWVVDSSTHESVLIKNTATNEVREARFDPLTNEFQALSLGQADQFWWPSRSSLPLWRHGSDLLTVDTNSQPLLLDRSAQLITFAAWLVPGHIVLTVDDHTVRIQSVSDRQGRGVILEQRFDEQIEPLGFNLNTKTLILRSTESPQQLVAVQW